MAAFFFFCIVLTRNTMAMIPISATAATLNLFVPANNPLGGATLFVTDEAAGGVILIGSTRRDMIF
jgi:hypothetical protein